MEAAAFWRRHWGRETWCAEKYGAPTLPRMWALEGLAALGAESAVELGCHCGPLLAMMQDAGMEPTGVDVNEAWVEMARRNGLSAKVGQVPECLERYATRGFDAVVSCYCLAYVSPADLPRTLAECLRIARLGVVLVEPSAGPGILPDEYYCDTYVEWRHEYLDALAAVAQSPLEMARHRKDDPDSNVNALIVVRHGRTE